MQHCKFCGAELQDRARFCSKCGRPLDEEKNVLVDMAVPLIPGTPAIGTVPMTPGIPSVGDMPTTSGTPLASSAPGTTPPHTIPPHATPTLHSMPPYGTPIPPHTSPPHATPTPPHETPIPPHTVPPHGTPTPPHTMPIAHTPPLTHPHTTPPHGTPMSPHTRPITHTTPLTQPHATPLHISSPHGTPLPPNTTTSPTQQPPSHSNHLPSQHTNTSSSHLHHSHTGLNADGNIPPKQKRSHRSYKATKEATAPSTQNKARRKRATARIVLVSIILLTVLGGSLALAGRIFGGPAPASSASVTITPVSTNLTNTYTVSVVTGTPDTSSNQVSGARMLSATTSSFSQTVNATGQGTTPEMQATGMLTFHEPYINTGPFTFNAGTVFNDDPNRTPNVQMMIDATITVPTNGNGDVTVPAHVVQIGTIGNIPIGGWTHYFNHSDAEPVDIHNSTPFTGGTDPQTYTVVKQSDIDGAARTLEQTNNPDPQRVLQGQISANERFIGTPQCTPHVTSDHAAGDKATNVTVSVAFTCMGEVYDSQAALSLAMKLLTDQAATKPGLEYVLAGNIVATVTNAALSNANQGTVMLTINTEGMWVYHFSAAQKQALAKLMVNKKKQDVQVLLLKQQGVSKVAIQLIGGDGTLFPTEPRQITIVVQNVPGV